MTPDRQDFEAWRRTMDNGFDAWDAWQAADKAATERERERAAKVEWLPIETAPKDGTNILVMYTHIETQVVHNAFWMSEKDCWDGDNPVGWWSYVRSEVSRELLDGWRTPTHWMPLPGAAAIRDGERKES